MKRQGDSVVSSISLSKIIVRYNPGISTISNFSAKLGIWISSSSIFFY